MFKYFNRNVSLITLMLLSACSFTTDGLKDDVKEEKQAVKTIEKKEVVKDSPSIEVEAKEEEFTFNPVTFNNNRPYSSLKNESGTFVGQKIAELKQELNEISNRGDTRNGELQKVRNKISEDARKYHEIVAVINSRLQVGTTPGNPILNEKWHQAGLELDAISSDVALLNGLLASLTADSGMITYIIDSIKAAFNISGAVDEDHAELKVLENAAAQASVQIERTFNEINLDINRQQQYMAIEKRNMNALAMAIRDGQLYTTNPIQSAYTPVISSTSANKDMIENISGKRALVTIRFDKRNVSYEQALFQAVKRALEKKSSVEFDLVGITPISGSTKGVDAKNSTDRVYKSLLNMGVPTNRIKVANITSSEVNNVEVRLFVK
ncbi:MAG: hypothetical protein BWY78_00206 [Alphaproteobacteria bacterium ADurb.Bin438]|nr:MAG: hypothetical protein BWY78_00206 [Alphaproteobacteria bacterium ADurb.Bin438]